VIQPPLTLLLDRLEDVYGQLRAPHPTQAVDLLLWDNVAYLVDDTKRRAAFDALVATLGRDPIAILAAEDARLLAVVGGMRPQDRVARLRRVAELALDLDLVPDPGVVLRQDLPIARRVLRRFPGIGEPGADRILLFCRYHLVLALDSNALRVLVRLGIGRDSANYRRSYRSAQAGAEAQLPRQFDALIRASLLLRHHGQTTCRRSEPRCGGCPLQPYCPTGRSCTGREHQGCA
jgi:adenine-specific DNA glycosylase